MTIKDMLDARAFYIDRLEISGEPRGEGDLIYSFWMEEGIPQEIQGEKVVGWEVYFREIPHEFDEYSTVLTVLFIQI